MGNRPRITGAIVRALCLAGIVLLGCAIAVKSPANPGPTEPAGRPPRSAFRSREFVLLYISWVLATTALFVPFVFLPAFARDHGASEVAAAALVSIIGGASIIRRLVLGPIGDRLGCCDAGYCQYDRRTD